MGGKRKRPLDCIEITKSIEKQGRKTIMNFGENIQNWFGTQIGALFLVIIGAVAIYFLVKRQFSQFVGFFVFALIVSVFVFAPDTVKSLGSKFFTTIFGK